jgi:hypothetical protein
MMSSLELDENIASFGTGRNESDAMQREQGAQQSLAVYSAVLEWREQGHALIDEVPGGLSPIRTLVLDNFRFRR